MMRIMIWFRIPMLALLFIGTRQRASRIDPKHGKSQRWAKTCFYSCTVSVCVQTILDHNALLFLLFAFSPQLVRLRPAAFSPPRLLASAGAPVTRRRFAFSPSRLLAFSPSPLRLLAFSSSPLCFVALSPSRLLAFALSLPRLFAFSPFRLLAFSPPRLSWCACVPPPLRLLASSPQLVRL